GLFGMGGTFMKDVGEERILDTPLSESAFMGAAVGATAAGMRPIVQSLSSFVWVAMDQIVSPAAKMRYMFGGQARLPIVYRFSMLWGARVAAHHSDRPHSMFMNMPGLKIVLATTPADAKGLMVTAIRDDDPVIFFEDRGVVGLRGEVPEGEYTIPFGVGDIKRVGSDVTVVALGGMMPRSLAVAEKLAKEGVSGEVVDPRTLVPLDKDIILKSVAKTGHLVVVDVAHSTCSAASEIAAMVAEQGFWDLRAPIQRVCSHNVHVPFSQALEDLVYPDEARIEAAIRATLQ
ncbi:MAG: transketolase C-terminal domain-containing protein, partial [Chloroflexota bacterium]|nr:transketolase C-terminal domain-containing protein [Chloroflexota bacterium]